MTTCKDIQDDESHPLYTFGRPPQNHRQLRSKAIWIGVWLIFLASPVKDLVDGGHGGAAVALGSLGLAAFVVCYLFLVFRFTTRILEWGVVYASLAVLFALAVVLSATLGDAWLGLFVYVSVSVGAVLPSRVAFWAIPVITVSLIAVALGLHDDAGDLFTGLVVTTLLVGFAMSGVRQLIRTTVQLRQARATVAQLAANEERLRLARDLHDLLGHSLSLITLKSELAGRMLPDRPEQAAQQVADIEQVSRQALTDVREAVTGYRRPTLPGELAGARTALAAAGIDPEVPLEPGVLPDDKREEALAWALREAVTNVVRHSGARRCAVTLRPHQTLDGRVLELLVEDDGAGSSGGGPGNGLTGMAERLEAVGGALEVSPGARGGFRLVARVPLTGERDQSGAASALGSPA